MDISGSERFGKFLRRLREQRKLSLDRVEELSHDHPERVTRSHLSRIENGQSLPTLPRLMTLSRLYGESVADLAERLEFDVQLEQAGPVDVTGHSADELEAEAKLEAERGDLMRAFHLLEAAADRIRLSGDSKDDPEHQLKIQLKLSTVLIRAGKLNLASDYAEAALTSPSLSTRSRVWAQMNLARIHRRLGRSILSQVLVENVLSFGDQVPAYLVADAKMTLGALKYAQGALDDACGLWSEALRIYRDLGRRYEDCQALGNLARGNLDRGRIGAAEKFSDLRVSVSKEEGFQGQLGWALQLHAIIAMEKGDGRLAAPLLRQSNEIARKVDDTEMLFISHFYQWKLAKLEGNEGNADSLRRIIRKIRSRIEAVTPDVEACDVELGD